MRRPQWICDKRAGIAIARKASHTREIRNSQVSRFMSFRLERLADMHLTRREVRTFRNST